MAVKIRRPSVSTTSGQVGLGNVLSEIDNQGIGVNNAVTTGTVNPQVNPQVNGQNPGIGAYSDPEADFLAASYMSSLQPTDNNPVFDVINQPSLQGNMSTPSLGSTPIFAGGGTILQRREQKINQAALKAVGGKRPEMKVPEAWAPHQKNLSADYTALVNRYYKVAVEKYGVSATKILQGDTKLGREFQAAKQNLTDYALQSSEMKAYYDKVAADIKTGAYVSEDARKAAEYVSSEKWMEDLMSGKNPDLVGNTMEALKADVRLQKLVNEVQIDSTIWQDMPSVTKQFESDAPDWTVLLQEKNITFADEAITRAVDSMWSDNPGLHDRYTREEAELMVRDRFQDDYIATIQKMKDEAATGSAITAQGTGTAIEAVKRNIAGLATTLKSPQKGSDVAVVKVAGATKKEQLANYKKGNYTVEKMPEMTQAQPYSIPGTKTKIMVGLNGITFDDAATNTTKTIPFNDPNKIASEVVMIMSKTTGVLPSTTSYADIMATIEEQNLSEDLLSGLFAEFPSQVLVQGPDGETVEVKNIGYQDMKNLTTKGIKEGEKAAEEEVVAAEAQAAKEVKESSGSFIGLYDWEGDVTEETKSRQKRADIGKLDAAVKAAKLTAGGIILDNGGKITDIIFKKTPDGGEESSIFQIRGSAGAIQGDQKGVLIPQSAAPAAFSAIAEDGSLVDKNNKTVAIKRGGWIFMPGYYYEKVYNEKDGVPVSSKYRIVDEAGKAITPLGGDFKVINSDVHQNLPADIIDNVILDASEQQSQKTPGGQILRIPGYVSSYGKDTKQVVSKTPADIIGASKNNIVNEKPTLRDEDVASARVFVSAYNLIESRAAKRNSTVTPEKVMTLLTNAEKNGTLNDLVTEAKRIGSGLPVERFLLDRLIQINKELTENK